MKPNKKFVKTSEACSKLGIHWHTLLRWSDAGEIETIKNPNGYRLFNVDGFINKKKEKEKEKKRISYCRVSTRNQKDDLLRQEKFMKKHYPGSTLISDIGSGINFKRKGLQEIIKVAINGDLEELIIAHKDRLCRFGYDLIEHIIKEYSNGKITILEDKKEDPKEEIVEDLVTIINVFSAKLNGKRKYKT